MGGYKEMMVQHEWDIALASRYLVQIGVLGTCEHHGFIFGGGPCPLDDWIYADAVAEKKEGHSGSVPWAAAMEMCEYTDLLNKAYKEHCADECPYCAKLLAD